MENLFDIIGFIVRVFVRLVFEIFLFNIGYYFFKLVTLGKHPRKLREHIKDPYFIFYFDLLGIFGLLILVELFFLLAQL